MEESGYDVKKVLWGVLDEHVVEEGKDHDEIGLWRFDFNLFDEDEEGVVRDGSSEYTYLLMLMKLWPKDWKNQLVRININLDDDNGKYTGMVNVRAHKVWRFSSNGILKNICCLVSASTRQDQR